MSNATGWICRKTGNTYLEVARESAGFGSHRIVTLEPLESGERVRVAEFALDDRFERQENE